MRNFRLSYKKYFMQQIFTPELLLKFLYSETNESESKLVRDALEKNEDWNTEFQQLQTVKYALDEQDGDTPPASVVNRILAYSKLQEMLAVE
jgi:hypothetical protein